MENIAAWIPWVLGFPFVLTMIVFFHELGHFLVARWCGVTVSAFSIGFGREIFGFTDSKGTRWRFAWIPLGGYVKFIDDDNVASAGAGDAPKALTPEQRAGMFHTKSLKQKAAIVAAGPIANFLLAIAILTGMYTVLGQQYRIAKIDRIEAGSPAAKAGLRPGDIVKAIDGTEVVGYGELQKTIAANPGKPLKLEVARDGTEATYTVVPVSRTTKTSGGKAYGDIGIRVVLPARVGGVEPGSPAAAAGFKLNDLIVEVDGNRISKFDDLVKFVSVKPEKPVRFKVERDGKRISLTATPARVSDKDPKTGRKKDVGRIGITGTFNPEDVKRRHYDPFTALWLGTERTYALTKFSIQMIGKMVTNEVSSKGLSGPIGIASAAGQAAAEGFDRLLTLTVIVSIGIGLLNLFPIPILDGGHLLFYGIEAIRGKPLSERVQGIGFRIGLVMLIMLMVFATRNDLLRWFTYWFA